MRVKLGIVGLLALVALVVPASAVTLQNGNSTALIDPTSPSGMYSWTVDGTNYLYQQWFWFRVGNTGGQQSLDSLPVVVNQTSPSSVEMTFTGQGFTIAIIFNLSGGQPGSGTADIAEQIRINNTGAAPLDFHFFQYSDFDLGGVGSQDVVFFPALPNHQVVTQRYGPTILSETVVTPAPSRWELNTWANTLVSLTSGYYNLNNNDAMTYGDATWAYQWDKVIAAGGSFLISKDKQLVVPEPLTMVSGFLAISGLGMYLRRRTAQKA